MSALAGKAGAIYVWDGNASQALTDEACTDSGDHQTYFITDDTKRYFDINVAVTVEVDASPVTNFSVVHAGGRIIFDSALAGTETVTVSANYFTLEQQAGFANWSIDSSVDFGDITAFEDSGWKRILPTLKEFSVSAERYWGNGVFFTRDTLYALALYVDYSNDYRYDCYAYLNGDSIECPVDDIVSESIEFTGHGILSYNVE